jgi:GNAT superfamily N-acetyltransferase
MSIRKAALEDWEGISRLLTQLEYPGTAAFMRTKLERMLNDPAETLLVWAEPPQPFEPSHPSELTRLSEPPTPSEPSPLAASPEPHPGPIEAPPMDSTPAILGLLSLHFIPQIALRGDFARISYFAVDNEVRSKGIGRQLEETATQLAKERGCALMEVHCHTRRTRAHEFYARQGWIESPKYLIKNL